MTKAERSSAQKRAIKDLVAAAHLLAGALYEEHPFIAADLRLLANQLDELAERLRC